MDVHHQNNRRTPSRNSSDDGEYSRNELKSHSEGSPSAASGSEEEIATTTQELKDLTKRGDFERQNPIRSAGRVTKRKRPTKRPNIKRKPKRKSKSKGERRKVRKSSMSTISTRVSSARESDVSGCKNCGHRCCRMRRYYRRCYCNRKINETRAKSKRKRKLPGIHIKRSDNEGVQIGSRCQMLSPLFVKTNATLTDKTGHDSPRCEISPEMLHESLRKLTMWKQYVETQLILNHIMRSYPVGDERSQLLEELLRKLHVASIMGIVENRGNNTWGLSPPFQKRKLPHHHVTMFWKIYGDTMKPVTRKPVSDAAVGRPASKTRETTPGDDYGDLYT